MPLRPALTALAATLAIAVPVSAALAHPGRDRSCGLFKDSSGARIGAVIKRGSVSCATTTHVLRWYLNSNAPCSGSACVRAHGGWTCASAGAYAFPRLASCTRGNVRIAAYSTAD